MRYISLLRAVVWFLAVVQAIYFLLAWLLPEVGHVGTVHVEFYPKALEASEVVGLPAAMRWSGTVIALPALLVTWYALWRLAALLRAFAAGRMFALATIGHLKGFAGAMLAALALSIIEPAVRGLVWRHLQGATVHVRIGISTEELSVMLVCGLFYVIAAMMHEGRRLAEENEGFV